MVLKKCPSYHGYSITKEGRVFTHRKRFGKGVGHGGGVEVDYKYSKELNHYLGHGGYKYVSISINSNQRSVPLHTLLLDAFVGPRPQGMEARHLDGDCLNNELSNLCWGTPQENAQDKIRCGAHCIGESHGMAKLKEGDIKKIRSLYEDKHTIASIARMYGRGESTIREIVKRTHWKHVL